MTHTASYQRPDLIERTLAAAAHFVSAVAARYAHHRIMQTSLNELRSLSMSELADLGLNPSMLKSIAKAAADQHMAQQP